MNCPSFEELVLYAEGDPSSTMLASHVAGCARCQSLLNDIGMLTEAIHDAAPAPADEILIQDILKRTRPQRKPSRPWILFMAVAAAAIVLVLPYAQRNTAEFLPRGQASQQPDRWVSIEVLHATKVHKLEPVRGSLSSVAALAFSYMRKPEEPYRYLMIFGLGAQGQVYWYFPAYTEKGGNPCSIELADKVAEGLLPDQVEHELAPGPFRIHAIFSMRPYCVADVENLVARERLNSSRDPSRLELSDTAQHILDFKVEAGLDGKD
jgi:hypothetical protein